MSLSTQALASPAAMERIKEIKDQVAEVQNLLVKMHGAESQLIRKGLRKDLHTAWAILAEMLNEAGARGKPRAEIVKCVVKIQDLTGSITLTSNELDRQRWSRIRSQQWQRLELLLADLEGVQ